MDEKLQALEADQIDMILATASNAIPDTVLLSVLDASPFYFTVKEGNRLLLNEINRGMQLLITTEPELVAETAQKCLVGDNTNALALTDDERAFVASNPEIVVGFYEETEPLAYLQGDGTYSGIYVKLMEYLRDTAGLNLTLRPISRSQDWKPLLKSGELDFYIGASENIARQDDELSSTNAILDYENILIMRRNCVFDSLDIKRSGRKGCCGSDSGYKPQKKKLDNVIATKVFTVEGMHCEKCAGRVTEVVNDIPGVAGVVNLKKGIVTVSYAENVPDAQIKARIERVGYTVTEIR